MIDLSNINIEAITAFINIHQHFTNLCIAAIAFLESLVIIGVIMPGAVTMPTIGFLIGTWIIPAGTTLMWSTIGAILGDFVSYLLGTYLQDRIHYLWPFTKWPKLLARSETFFNKHGGKSVFVCRFIGPLRAMVPVVAGASKLSLHRFLFASIPAAALWSLVYMIPGILLGAISMELPPKIAAQFVLGTLLLLVGIWLFIWIIENTFRKFFQICDHYIMRLWQYLQKRPALAKVIDYISDPQEPDNHQQLTLIIAVFCSILLFILVANQAISSGIIFEFSKKIYYLLSSIRIKWLDYFFVMITSLGDPPFILLFSGLIFLLLRWKKNWYSAIHWFFLVAGTCLAFQISRILIHVSRPGEILYNLHSSSFPSGHVLLSAAIYGFLAIIIARGVDRDSRRIVYTSTVALISAIAFSRIYLGAHWLCDILGGFLIGLIILLVTTVMYRRRHLLHFDVKKFVGVALIIIGCSWIGYNAATFSKRFGYYSLTWPKHTTTFDSLIKKGLGEIPLYRLDRLGKPIEPLNLLYIGNVDTVQQSLLKQGWKIQKLKMDFNDLIKSISPSAEGRHIPVFTQLYRNRKPIMVFTKISFEDNEISILKLWSSEIDLVDSDSPVWIGSIENRPVNDARFSWKRFKNPSIFIGVTELLAGDLEEEFELQHRIYDNIGDHLYPVNLDWDKKLLIVKEN